MARLKPLNDFIFQKLMGEQGSEDELKSFLSAVLGRELKEITILENKDLTPEIIGDKKSILDVRATTDDKTQINIEIQINPYKFMDARSLYYWSRLYGAALEAGMDYKELPNVVTINILDFGYSYIKVDRFHTKFHIWEDLERYLLTDDFELHFIEMHKFRKLKEKDLLNEPLHRWLTFFDEQTADSTVKELVEMDAAIQKANSKLNFLSQDKEFLHQANLREIALSDYTTAMNDAAFDGEEKAKKQIAKNLIEMGMSNEQISKGTGLTITEVINIRNN